MDFTQAGLYLLTALALLGSPGPAVVVLLSVARAGGWRMGLRTYAGLELALGLVAALTLGGVYALIISLPFAKPVLLALSLAYLIYLAYRIATAPVGVLQGGSVKTPGGFKAGLMLAVFNPKVYLSFAVLFSTFTLLPSATHDAVAKWLLLMLVLLCVDFLWVCAGVILSKIVLEPSTERMVNRSMAFVLILSVIVAFVAA